jgi:hypothetical protein
MLINKTETCCIEHRSHVFLTAGVYYDLVIEYNELVGSAFITLHYSSASVRKQIIPSSRFFHATSIVGSPFNTTIVPGAADHPYTDAFGDGLANAQAGKIANFYVQTKDAMGNNKTSDFEFVNPLDLLSITITNNQTIYYADVQYLGNGLFQVSYQPLFTGSYSIYVKMGLNDIYCGKGLNNKCSPFNLAVTSGPTIPLTTEAESPSVETMDYLKEAVAGEYGYFYPLYTSEADAKSADNLAGGAGVSQIFTFAEHVGTEFYMPLMDQNIAIVCFNYISY